MIFYFEFLYKNLSSLEQVYCPEMTAFARQKECISDIIRSGTRRADLYSLIDSIDHSDLQSLFLDFVSRQTSSEKVVKM